MSIEQHPGSPADRVSTAVDGVEVLGALSPSRAGDFMSCPLLYRFRTIDRLPEPSSPDAVRGSLILKVLEDLFDLPAVGRTPEQARSMLVPTWEALLAEEPEIAEMFAPAGEGGTDVDSWLVTCREVLDRYFDLEDPRQLEPAERELYVEALLDSKLLLRGFIDRVEFGKPHPEPYLTAAAELGVAPSDCIAIEDSNTGAKSGEAAGCLVLCVPNHVPILDGERRVFRDTLVGMSPADLGAL